MFLLMFSNAKISLRFWGFKIFKIFGTHLQLLIRLNLKNPLLITGVLIKWEINCYHYNLHNSENCNLRGLKAGLKNTSLLRAGPTRSPSGPGLKKWPNLVRIYNTPSIRYIHDLKFDIRYIYNKIYDKQYTYTILK